MFEFIGHLLFGVLIWVLLLPISLILVTPVIVVGALFTQRDYWTSLKAGYGEVVEFWGRMVAVSA
jgi:hypothetical protein